MKNWACNGITATEAHILACYAKDWARLGLWFPNLHVMAVKETDAQMILYAD